MPAHGKPVPGAAEWLRRARRNLRIARSVLEDAFFDAAAFHAQQAAEMALKALQIHRTGTFMKVHDVKQLATNLSAPAAVVQLSALLSPAYTGTRYPDAGGRITRRDAVDAIDAARRTVRWVESEMP